MQEGPAEDDSRSKREKCRAIVTNQSAAKAEDESRRRVAGTKRNRNRSGARCGAAEISNRRRQATRRTTTRSLQKWTFWEESCV